MLLIWYKIQWVSFTLRSSFMCEITTIVNCPHCKGSKVKKNGKKRTGKQNFLCHGCKNRLQFEYSYRGADPGTKGLVCAMALNGSGIRDIQRVLRLSIACILVLLRGWFKQHGNPSAKAATNKCRLMGPGHL
jgi:transposase-like protein